VRVVEIDSESVTVDGNHPLAGKVLELEVSLISLDSSPTPINKSPSSTWKGEDDRWLRV